MSTESSPEIEAKVFGKQVEILYTNAPPAVPFNVVIPSILVAVFWSAAPHLALLTWLGALSLLSALRLVHVRYVLRHSDFVRNAKQLVRQFMIGSTGTALLWGAGFVTFGMALEPSYQMLFLLTVGGMAAGAFSSMGTCRSVYLLFLAGLFLPPMAAFLAQPKPLSLYTELLLCLFVGMLAATQRVAYRMWVAGIRTTLHNQILVDRLARANNELETAKDKLEQLAITDALTRIPNRHYFEQKLAAEWERAFDHGLSIACFMIDIDDFKQYNDTYGHIAGDHCLTRIAETLDREMHRPSDVVARYGGEEFVTLLGETDLRGALAVADRLRKGVLSLALRHDKSSSSPYVTISLGVASAIPQKRSGKQALINAADEALYAAKRQGKNRIVAVEK